MIPIFNLNYIYYIFVVLSCRIPGEIFYVIADAGLLSMLGHMTLSVTPPARGRDPRIIF